MNPSVASTLWLQVFLGNASCASCPFDLTNGVQQPSLHSYLFSLGLVLSVTFLVQSRFAEDFTEKPITVLIFKE